MHNKVLVFEVDEYSDGYIEEKINKELYDGWLIELYYEARGAKGNKLIVTFYREEKSFRQTDKPYEHEGWRPSTPEEWEEFKSELARGMKEEYDWDIEADRDKYSTGGVLNKNEINALLQALDTNNPANFEDDRK